MAFTGFIRIGRFNDTIAGLRLIQDGSGVALHVETGVTQLDGDVQLATRLLSSSATEIGIQVTNGSLTVGSLGSLVIPVKTDAGAPVDADMGNLNGAFGFNSNSNTLEIRTAVDTYQSVGVAGVVIQRKAPTLTSLDGWYHPQQYLEGSLKYADETRCIVCGEEMQPGDKLALYANGRVRADDLHAIYGHPHEERSPTIQRLTERVKELEDLVGMGKIQKGSEIKDG